MYEVKYTEEQLKKCGISFLRNYARELGGTPKLMNKSELIGYILDIQNKNIVPERNNTGRKPLDMKGVSYGVLGMVNLKFREKDEDSAEIKADSDVIRGFFEHIANGMGMIGGASASVYVPRALIDRYYLKDGDFIVGKWERGRNDALVLTRIDEINGVAAEESLTRVNFDKAAAVYPKTRVSFSKMGSIGKAIDLFCPIGKGQRALWKLRAGDDEISAAEKIISAFKDGGVRTVVCYLNSRPEDKRYLEEVCDEAVCTGFEADGEAHRKAVLKALDRAKTIAENGEDAVLMLATLESAKAALGDDFDKTLKSVFSSAKNTENCNSVTLIALTFSSEIFKRYEPCANCLIAADGKTLDILSSYTRRGEIMLDERERSVSERLREISDTEISAKVKAAFSSAVAGEELSALEKLF